MTLAQRVNAFLNPPALTVVQPEQKAVTGAGAYVMEYHEPLARSQRDPMKYQRSCQAISRKNPWVNTAEAIISGKDRSIGTFDSEAEAAFAREYALSLGEHIKGRPNRVTETILPDPTKVNEIRRRVDARIALILAGKPLRGPS